MNAKCSQYDVAEMQSLGGWGCVVAMYHVKAIIIQLCSREELSFSDLTLFYMDTAHA